MSRRRRRERALRSYLWANCAIEPTLGKRGSNAHTSKRSFRRWRGRTIMEPDYRRWVRRLPWYPWLQTNPMNHAMYCCITQTAEEIRRIEDGRFMALIGATA